MNIRVTKDSVELEGYVNAVERLSKPLKDRLGKFVERVKVGAFKKALERAEDVRILLNHDWKRDLGGIKDGNLELYEDAIGLHARATITDKDVVEQAKRGERHRLSRAASSRARTHPPPISRWPRSRRPPAHPSGQSTCRRGRRSPGRRGSPRRCRA